MMSGDLHCGRTTGGSSPDVLTDGTAAWSVDALRGASVTVEGRGVATVLANSSTTLQLAASFHPPIAGDTAYSINRN